MFVRFSIVFCMYVCLVFFFNFFSMEMTILEIWGDFVSVHAGVCGEKLLMHCFVIWFQIHIFFHLLHSSMNYDHGVHWLHEPSILF